MNEILEKVILIQKVEKTLTKTQKKLIKVRDENNLGYQLWPIKQDQTESKAYQFFKNLPMDGMGMNVKISYKEEKSEYNGKPVTYRTIIGMQDAAQASLGTKVAKQGQAMDKVEKEEEKWDKISWGKCKTLFLVEAYKVWVINTQAPIDYNLYMNNREMEAEEWADMCMRNRKEKNIPPILTPAQELGIDEDEINLNEPPF